MFRCTGFALLMSLAAVAAHAAERQVVPLWTGEMPGPGVDAPDGETTIPLKPGAPVITRTTNIAHPSLVVFEGVADKRTEVGVIVLPGGGFRYLTTDLEGSEACEWLASQGITAFLLKHRAPTHEHPAPNAGPAIDTHQALKLVRQRAGEWKLDPQKIGLLGFSAGGQIAAVATSDPKSRPNFLMLLYPWGLYQAKEGTLREDVRVDAQWPPTFLAQAADDGSSLPQGSLLLYTRLLEQKIPAELHIYEKGGHGFGIRPGKAACPTDWPHRAETWLQGRGLLPAAK